MKVGSICYATSRGLGHLCRDFYKNQVITDVMVMEHGRVPTNWDWYPGAPKTSLQRMDLLAMQEFCQGKDAMLFFETPFSWSLFEHCRRIGVRTYLVTMYECTPRLHVPPYAYLCPSVLDYDIFSASVEREDDTRAFKYKWKAVPGMGGARAVWVDLPVEYPWRRRDKALEFVHNGGYLGMKTRAGRVTREGTTTLIEAMKHVKSPISLTIRVQENVPPEYVRACDGDSRIRYLPESVQYQELYADGDVCVGAQRWNGCSLPLQEAFASGMLVINTDRYPMNTWLPNGPLVPVRNWLKGSSIGGSYMPFDEADVHPEDLAEKIDEWYGRDICGVSLWGQRWAETMSWSALKPKWMEVLSE